MDFRKCIICTSHARKIYATFLLFINIMVHHDNSYLRGSCRAFEARGIAIMYALLVIAMLHVSSQVDRTFLMCFNA